MNNGITFSIAIALAFCSCGVESRQNPDLIVVVDSVSVPVTENVNEMSELDSIEFEESDTFTKEIDLFILRTMDYNPESKIGFVSLSDVYILNEDRDDPIMPEHGEIQTDSSKRFLLRSNFRKVFLEKTGISEMDSLFIYDYSTDVLKSFSVKQLELVAWLNDYMGLVDCPCSEEDYMIGFEIDLKKVSGLGKYYSDVVVFIGKENPFVRGGMKAIVWEKIGVDDFPIGKSRETERLSRSLNKNLKKAGTYQYSSGQFYVFIQDYGQMKNTVQVDLRHLMVVEKQAGEVVNELIFYSSEGSMVTPLNFGVNNPGQPDLKVQWMGTMFRNKPEVIFGFEWLSFSCPVLYFVNSPKKYVQINCDSRH